MENNIDRDEQGYARALQHKRERVRLPRQTRQTRIRLVDNEGETIGFVWTHADADDTHIHSLIPEGIKAMVRRNVWP